MRIEKCSLREKFLKWMTNVRNKQTQTLYKKLHHICIRHDYVIWKQCQIGETYKHYPSFFLKNTQGIAFDYCNFKFKWKINIHNRLPRYVQYRNAFRMMNANKLNTEKLHKKNTHTKMQDRSQNTKAENFATCFI